MAASPGGAVAQLSWLASYHDDGHSPDYWKHIGRSISHIAALVVTSEQSASHPQRSDQPWSPVDPLPDTGGEEHPLGPEWNHECRTGGRSLPLQQPGPAAWSSSLAADLKASLSFRSALLGCVSSNIVGACVEVGEAPVDLVCYVTPEIDEDAAEDLRSAEADVGVGPPTRGLRHQPVRSLRSPGPGDR